MRLDITGRHVDITPALRQLIDKRLARLGRLLNDSAISAQVILSKEKYRLQSEIVVHARDDRTLRGSGEDRTWAGAIRQASVKIEQQAQKVKGKWEQRKRRAASPRVVADADAASAPAGPRVIRASRYAVKPMSIEDAALQVAARAESFVVFRNAETDAVSILYKRKDGNLGLIEPD
ncbi:MAG: ribosome-associated translation inhibitor RaiA [Vicinamibacterales bacterium]